jgi:hypothetical protein
MQDPAIFAPLLGMMLLTLVVFLVMYTRRLSYLVANKVDLRAINTRDKVAGAVPEEISYASDNLKNLFELPTLFYAMCLYLYVTASVDTPYLIAAWWFFGFRIVHSYIHCTSNVVRHRFGAYAISAAGLFFMVVRAAIQGFSS